MGRVPTGPREGERLLTSGLLRPWAPCTLLRCRRISTLMLVLLDQLRSLPRQLHPVSWTCRGAGLPAPASLSSMAYSINLQRKGCLLTQKHTPPPAVSLGTITKVTTAHIRTLHRILCPPASQSAGHPRASDSAPCVHLELGCLLLGSSVLGCLESPTPCRHSPRFSLDHTSQQSSPALAWPMDC